MDGFATWMWNNFGIEVEFIEFTSRFLIWLDVESKIDSPTKCEKIYTISYWLNVKFSKQLKFQNSPSHKWVKNAEHSWYFHFQICKYTVHQRMFLLLFWILTLHSMNFPINQIQNREKAREREREQKKNLCEEVL